MFTGIINALRRNPKLDQPELVFFALIGNDVCNGHPGLGSMTTVRLCGRLVWHLFVSSLARYLCLQPAEFQAAVTSSLQYLDTVLPAGSFVLFIGLVDGRVLWDTMNS